jgi:hypothetical protein
MNKFLYNLKEISIYNTKFVHCDISTCSNQLEKTVRLFNEKITNRYKFSLLSVMLTHKIQILLSIQI